MDTHSCSTRRVLLKRRGGEQGGGGGGGGGGSNLSQKLPSPCLSGRAEVLLASRLKTVRPFEQHFYFEDSDQNGSIDNQDAVGGNEYC